MTIKNICFFNHFHNGDIFHSKEFVRDILEQTGLRGFYSHNCSSNILSDLDVESVPLLSLERKQWYGSINDTLFLNTWIGAYFDQGLKHTNECTLRFNYSIYEKIYNDLQKNLNLKLSPIGKYFPFINFKNYRIEAIDDFITSVEGKKKVLLSNGNCFSGQCNNYPNMTSTVIKLVDYFKDIVFFATNKIQYQAENLFFTDDITYPRIGCDLNEIGYLSTFCDLIVGRNSGPYCFATNRQNILNPKKKFFAFGERETDCFFYGIDLPCTFIFHKFENEEKLNNNLMSIIEEIQRDDRRKEK